MQYYLVTEELYHHGIKGQKWGVRRFQNEDGTRKAAGKRHRQEIEGAHPFRERMKAAREARKAVRAEKHELRQQKKEEKKAERFEKKKRDIIASGDIKKIQKFAKHLDVNELRLANEKVKSLQDLKDQDAREFERGKKTVLGLIEMGTKGFDAYKNVSAFMTERANAAEKKRQEALDKAKKKITDEKEAKRIEELYKITSEEDFKKKLASGIIKNPNEIKGLTDLQKLYESNENAIRKNSERENKARSEAESKERAAAEAKSQAEEKARSEAAAKAAKEKASAIINRGKEAAKIREQKSNISMKQVLDRINGKKYEQQKSALERSIYENKHDDNRAHNEAVYRSYGMSKSEAKKSAQKISDRERAADLVSASYLSNGFGSYPSVSSVKADGRTKAGKGVASYLSSSDFMMTYASDISGTSWINEKKKK